MISIAVKIHIKYKYMAVELIQIASKLPDEGFSLIRAFKCATHYYAGERGSRRR